MRKTLAPRFILLTALLVVSALPAFAQNDADKIDLKTGEWARLAPHIGTYNYDAVLKDKDVKARLDKILKGRKIDIAQQLEVSSPIGFENDCLILKGNPQRSADTNRAYMEVCLGAGSVNLGIFDSGAITVYTSMDGYQYLNSGLRTWIYQQNHQSDLLQAPENVQFVVVKE